MLPTILFILAAYALYILVMWWCRWQRAHLWARQTQARPRWLTFSTSAGILVVFLGLLWWLAPPPPDGKLRLAGILGLAEGEMGLAATAPPAVLPGSTGAPAPNGQPAYAHLHPASPPSLQPPAKPLAGSVIRKPKGSGTAPQTPSAPKGDAKPNKKDKSPAKVKSGKKKSIQSSTGKTRGPVG